MAPTISGTMGIKQKQYCDMRSEWKYDHKSKIYILVFLTIKKAQMRPARLLISLSKLFLVKICSRAPAHMSPFNQHSPAAEGNVAGEEREIWSEQRWQSCLRDKCSLSPIKEGECKSKQVCEWKTGEDVRRGREEGWEGVVSNNKSNLNLKLTRCRDCRVLKYEGTTKDNRGGENEN